MQKKLIQVTPPMLKWLKKEAKLKGMPVNTFIRVLIYEAIVKAGP